MTSDIINYRIAMELYEEVQAFAFSASQRPQVPFGCLGPKDSTDSQNSRKEDMHIVLRHNVDGLGLGASLGFSRFLR